MLEMDRRQAEEYESRQQAHEREIYSDEPYGQIVPSRKPIVTQQEDRTMATPRMQMRQEDPEERAKRLLDRLAELRDDLAARNTRYDVEIEALEDEIPDEIRTKIEATKKTRDEDMAQINELIAGVDADVRDAVISVGETVNNGTLQAVYQVRTTWDTKKLEGYAAAHPEVEKFRTQKASVTIRAGNAKQRDV